MPGIWAVDRLGRRSLLMIGAVWVLFLLFFFELFLNRSWSSKSNLTFFVFFVLSFFGFDLQAVMCICQLIVAILGLVVSNSNISGQHALVAFVCIFIGGFASTWVSVFFFLSPYQSSLCVCVFGHGFFDNWHFLESYLSMIVVGCGSKGPIAWWASWYYLLHPLSASQSFETWV